MIWFGFIFVCIGAADVWLKLLPVHLDLDLGHTITSGRWVWVGSSVKDEPWPLCLNNALLYIGIDIAFAIIGIDCENDLY